MKRLDLLFLMPLPATVAMAQNSRLTTSGAKTSADPASDELANIVVLCATKHESAKWQSKWAN